MLRQSLFEVIGAGLASRGAGEPRAREAGALVDVFRSRRPALRRRPLQAVHRRPAAAVARGAERVLRSDNSVGAAFHLPASVRRRLQVSDGTLADRQRIALLLLLLAVNAGRRRVEASTMTVLERRRRLLHQGRVDRMAFLVDDLVQAGVIDVIADVPRRRLSPLSASSESTMLEFLVIFIINNLLKK